MGTMARVLQPCCSFPHRHPLVSFSAAPLFSTRQSIGSWRGWGRRRGSRRGASGNNDHALGLRREEERSGGEEAAAAGEEEAAAAGEEEAAAAGEAEASAVGGGLGHGLASFCSLTALSGLYMFNA